MSIRDVQITGLAPGYHNTRVTLDGTEVSRGLSGLTLQADAGDIPRLTLDLCMLDITKVGGQMEILLSDATRELLVELGWTPPANE